MIKPSVDPAEIQDIPFDFSSDIGAAAISGAPVVTVVVENGEDANPAAQLLGAPVVSGAIVFQRRQLGSDGVDYYWKCVATLTDGRKISRGAVIPVRDAGRRAND